MINLLFSDCRYVQRVRRSLLGAHVDALATLLLEQGYSKNTVRHKISVVVDLDRWLQRKHHRLSDLNEKRAEAFLHFRGSYAVIRCGDSRTLELFIDQLRSSGAISPPSPKPRESPMGRLLRDYTDYLRQERGLSKLTIAGYVSRVRSFLYERFGNRGIRLRALCQADTNRYIQRKSITFRPATLHGLIAALRSFFRFLYLRGDIGTDLASGVPAVACWRLATIPKFLTPDEIRRLLDSCDLATIRGQRDYTVLLLLARLGLRAGELVAMTVDDINWDAGEIMVRGKGKRHDRLPLPKDVGEALATYLRHGRPACSARHVFVRLYAPHRGFASSSDISTIVRQAIDRAGLHPPCKGAHLLRHTLATHMLHRGSSLAEIGEVLRHRCLNTTEIYSKVAIEALRALAQPWPGARV